MRQRIDRAFADSAERACEEALLSVGFSRPRRGTILLAIDKDFSGWVGLNRGVHKEFVRINPFVGIHCHPIMRLCDELEGEKYANGRIATFAVHLGEICPDIDAFKFHDEQEVSSESKRLADVVRVHGAPYMRSLADYGRLLPALIERVPTLGGYPERVAALLLLTGRRREAEEFVQERLKEYEKFDETVQSSFARFAMPFLELAKKS